MTEFNAKIDGLLFDLDGVFYLGSKIIPGALEALEFCEKAKLPMRFITNTSTKTVTDIAATLNAMGLPIPASQIFSSVTATVQFLERLEQPKIHLLVRESIESEFDRFEKESESPDYIVIGDIGNAWNYDLMNELFNKVMNGAALIALHRNKYWLNDDGLQMDIGAFIAGLEYVTGQQASIAGKPSSLFFATALEALKTQAARTAIVGDDILNDIGGGKSSGLQTIMVKTGKYREDVFAAAEIEPDVLIDSIADLPELLSGLQS